MGMKPINERRIVGIKSNSNKNDILQKYPDFIENPDGTISIPILVKDKIPISTYTELLNRVKQ